MMRIDRTIVNFDADRVSPRAAGRAGGSAIVLVVVSLVMIALLGMAYLQQVKMDRFTTQAYEAEQVDQVIAGILDDVQTRLTEDLRRGDSAGNPDGRPLYDYPWTDHGVPSEVQAVPLNGPPQNVSGSAFDDRHLATTAPLIAGTNDRDVVWPHLTNLGGLWVDLPDPNFAGSNPATTAEQDLIETDAADDPNSDTGLSLDHLRQRRNPRFLPRGFDADGDGIEDSRWTWAPPSVRTIDGKQYVMAVRIIDLSSLINVNTATRMTDNGTDFIPAPGFSPRGYLPTDGDLSRLASRALDPSGSLFPTATWRSNLASLLRARGVGNTADPDAPFPGFDPTFVLSVNQREDVWEEQASLYGDFAFSYGLQNELALRHLGGLNDTSTVTPLEDDADDLLRANAGMTDEQTWAHVVDASSPSSARLSDWFYGGVDLGDAATATPMADRAFPGIRHLLTTASGAATFAPDLDQGVAPAGVEEVQLNLRASPFPDDDEIRDVLREVLELPGRNATGSVTTARYGEDFAGGLGTAQVASADDLEDLLAEYTASILSYADSDSQPEGVTSQRSGGAEFYGLERLPFLRQFYVQALYEYKDLEDAAGVRDGEPGFTSLDGVPDTWVLADNGADDTEALAIELVNPFPQELTDDQLDHVTLRLRQAPAGNPTGGTTDTIDLDAEGADFVGAPVSLDMDPRDDNGSDDTLILWTRANDTTDDSDGDGGNIRASLNWDAQAADAEVRGGFRVDRAGGGRIVLELEVDPEGTGAAVVYDRMVIDRGSRLFPNEIRDTTGGTLDERRFFQFSAFRRGDPATDGLTYLMDGVDASTGTVVSTIGTEEREPESDRSYATASDFDLGDDNKAGTPSGPSLPDGFQLMVADDPDDVIRSVSELAWVSMVGFSDAQPFNVRLRLLAEDERRLQLDIGFELTGVVVAPPAGLDRVPEVPHAALLLDLFTAVGVNDDNIDQDDADGDGDPTTDGTNDDDEEFFVRGRINVNTATLPVLTLAAPLPDASLGDTALLMRAITKYRDDPLMSGIGGSVKSAYDLSDPVDAPREPIGTPNFRIGSRRAAQPGIASLGELLFVNPTVGGATGGGGNLEVDMQRHAINMEDLDAVNPLLDLFPDPAQPTRSSVRGGQESALARFQFLSQLFTVRSDRYAVYAVVRGYRAGAFDEGPVEEARFIAIIDRGNVLDPEEDRARVIGFARLR